MARFARLHCPGGIFHIISRCFERRYLLHDDAVYSRYIDLFERILERVDTKLLAWCIMSNHIHLVVKAGEQPLSKFMKPLQAGVAGYINKRSNRIGPVFADRYKAILVEEDSYLLELIRYVHNNPVRAGLVRRAAESKRSSHRCYIGAEEAPAWLNIGLVLGMVSARVEAAPALFDEFVDDMSSDGRRPEFCGYRSRELRSFFKKFIGDGWRLSDGILGSEAFIKRIINDLNDVEDDRGSFSEQEEEPTVPSIMEIVATACAVAGIEQWEYEMRPKARTSQTVKQILAWLWTKRFRQKQAELSRLLGVSSEMVSRWCCRATERFPELEPLIDQVVEHLDRPPLAPHGTAERGKEPNCSISYRLRVTVPE